VAQRLDDVIVRDARRRPRAPFPETKELVAGYRIVDVELPPPSPDRHRASAGRRS
jgi:hypothetical protein